VSDRVVIDGDVSLTSTIDGEGNAFIRLGQNPIIEPLEVTENGVYEVPEGVEGFNPVTVALPEYEGDYTVEPSTEEQILATAGKVMTGDVTVKVAERPAWYSDDVDDFNGGNILALISHKNEYIDTGYYPKVCTEYFLKATKDKQYLRYENLFAALFESVGTRVGIEMYASSLTDISYYTTSSSTFSNVPSSLSADVPTILSTRHLLSADPNTVATRPLLIFYGYHKTSLNVKSGFNFFGLKCYEFGKLVKKYVPWLDDNNVPCVRELVNDEYLYNAGTGAFGYIDLEGNIHDTI
jgi:hypothetical protein